MRRSRIEEEEVERSKKNEENVKLRVLFFTHFGCSFIFIGKMKYEIAGMNNIVCGRNRSS